MRIKTIFAPEHGFRGDVSAGIPVRDGKDVKTGIPLVSIYGSNKKPKPEQLEGIELMVFDIQDVGARFYTYISSLHYVMEACAEANIPLMILDRPNPNGHYVDGPILDPAFKSFVGMHPVPVVHGMTIGEYAQMINGEKWLNEGIHCQLIVIQLLNWTHQTPYELPVNPSPNLPNSRSIALYPSLCFFEGTPVSIGRGTDFPFQVIGYPNNPNGDFRFKPQSLPGVAKYPRFENETCVGIDLRTKETPKGKIQLGYLLEFYHSYPEKEVFFTDFFDKLAGTDELRKQIQNGADEEEIRKSWSENLNKFKRKRALYLLYN